MPTPQSRKYYVGTYVRSAMASYETAMGTSWGDLTQKQKHRARILLRRKLRDTLKTNFLEVGSEFDSVAWDAQVTEQSLTSAFNTAATNASASMITDIGTNGLTRS